MRWTRSLLVFLGASTCAGAVWAQPSPHPPSPTADQVRLNPEVPPGSVRVLLRDSNGQPLPGRQVSLGISRSSVGEGDTQESQTASTNGIGAATFSKLETASAYSYQVSLREGAATFSSEPFRLDARFGHEAVLHTFPWSHDAESASVQLRGILFLAPHEDVFKLELVLDIGSFGAMAWVPRDYRLALPAGAKAFQTERGDLGPYLVGDEDAVRVEGTVRPGQHRVFGSFQLPNRAQNLLPWAQSSSTTFRLGLPPAFGRFSVVAERLPELGLSVPGFGPAEATKGTGERPLLVSHWLAEADDPSLEEVVVTVDNLPTRGTLPFVTLLGVLGLVAWGLSVPWQGRSGSRAGLFPDDIAEARRLLLRELVDLEAAHERQLIGPSTYATARRALIGALARLEPARAPAASPRRGRRLRKA